MKQGLYEQIINNITSQQLSALDPEIYEIGREVRRTQEDRSDL